MARTALAPIVGALNAGVVDTAAVAADQANGMVIAKAKFRKLSFRITNSAGSTPTVIFRAGTYPVAALQPQGDVVISVPVGAVGTWVDRIDSARCSQNNGDLNIDFSAGFVGTITAYQATHS